MYTVRLLPSGHRYHVPGGDTLLEGALRAGLAPNYGCSNGNCGLCKARVVSGRVIKTRPHDYVLSPTEKATGYVLMCSNAPVADVEIEAGEARAPGEIPRQHIVARVRALASLAPDVTLLHLQTPRTQRLRFLAGQSVALTCGEARAELPVASCPCDDRNLHFHLASDDGAFARQAATLHLGDPVVVDGPFGEFTLAESGRPALFIAADVGFAPIKSLIEHQMAVDDTRAMHFYWLARAGGHYLGNLCRAWTDALDRFHYTPIVADASDYDRALASIASAHADFAALDVYVGGGAALLAAAQGAFCAVPPASLRLSAVAGA